MREFSSPHHWMRCGTLLTCIPPTTLSPTIPSTEVIASELRTGKSMGTTIPKTIEPSMMENTLSAATTIITDEDYEEIIKRLAKIGKKISILMMNWWA